MPHVSRLTHTTSRSDTITLRYRSEFDESVEALWGFHLRPDALERLSPPLSGFRVVDRGQGVADGSVLTAEVGPWPFKKRWVALHSGVEKYRSFTDVALESPFPYWVHIHQFDDLGNGRSRLTDAIWFVPPRWIGTVLGRAVVRPLLRAMFWWRHRATRRALSEWAGCCARMRNFVPACGQVSAGGST